MIASVKMEYVVYISYLSNLSHLLAPPFYCFFLVIKRSAPFLQFGRCAVNILCIKRLGK